jgi:hypothetical protein
MGRREIQRWPPPCNGVAVVSELQCCDPTEAARDTNQLAKVITDLTTRTATESPDSGNDTARSHAGGSEA